MNAMEQARKRWDAIAKPLHSLGRLGMEPIIHARMALGEGTGGVLLLPLLDMALRVYHGPHTFEHLGMEAYTPQEDAE